MSLKEMIGKEMIHDDFGLVRVVSVPKKAKTTVHIKVIQRGRGWHEPTERYRRYFEGAVLQPDGTRSLKWGLTHRDEYGHEEDVHIKTLNSLSS